MTTVSIITTTTAVGWICTCGKKFTFWEKDWPHFPQADVNRHLDKYGCQPQGRYLMGLAYRVRRGGGLNPIPSWWDRCGQPQDAHYDKKDVKIF